MLILVLLTAFLLALSEAKPASAAVPAGFEDKLVASTGQPTALEFTPDGRMLIADKAGRLRVYKEGVLLAPPALDISGRVCANSERGLLGVTVDPDFETNHHIYLYYTAKVGTTCDGSRDEVNRVSRFTMSGDTVDPASEKNLIDNIPSPAGNHNAGDLHFGKDGYLYISVGDGGCDYTDPTKCQNANDAARDRHVLLGKILRVEVTPDGGTAIPSDNPFTGSESARCNVNGRTTAGHNCQETFAWGLRNPYRIAFDPDAAGTSFRINDVGGGYFEEIDVGQKGADYGWNCREATRINSTSGECDPAPPGMVYPIHKYSHTTGCSSITGGAFVPDGTWSTTYDNAYLFGDYVCNKIFMLTPESGGGFTSSEFATGLGGGGPIAMAFGPSRSGEALYYTTFANGGEVRRIGYARDPIASIEADKTYGEIPLTVNFDGSGSSDPNNDTLTYEWDFTGDSTVDATGPTATHTYENAGVYTAKLTVRDGNTGQDTATLEIQPGNTPPEPKIESPTPTTLFVVGQRIALRGSVTDAQDVTEPALSWEVVRHHNANHTHPYFSATGSSSTFVAPAPEDLLSTNPAGNYLEIRLTATDSQGLSKTVTRRLSPHTVWVRFGTRPTGLRLVANGTSFRAPKTFVSWQGYKLNVYAPPQRYDGKRWLFDSWSDGRAARHTITTPADPALYIARFEPRR